MQTAFGSASLGKGLFAVLTWITLAAALCTGLFFTSDCLSEEKREGTLGFLFLTDLRGYDVVLGKLFATSLRCFYALLALLPILGITILMGGVTGVQFWKTSLALVNALFISLVVGIFVSAISREAQKAMAGTLLLLVLWVAAGLAIDASLAALPGRAFKPIFSLSSPGYLFVTASGWSGALFWKALLVNQAMAWLLLGVSCLLLPRLWQETGTRNSTGLENFNYRWTVWGHEAPSESSQAGRRGSCFVAGLPRAVAGHRAVGVGNSDGGNFRGCIQPDSVSRLVVRVGLAWRGVHAGGLFGDFIAGGAFFC